MIEALEALREVLQMAGQYAERRAAEGDANAWRQAYAAESAAWREWAAVASDWMQSADARIQSLEADAAELRLHLAEQAEWSHWADGQLRAAPGGDQFPASRPD